MELKKIWLILLTFILTHDYCGCVEINLTSVIGPKSLPFLNTFQNISYNHSIYVQQCSVSNIKNLSSGQYNYWYSYQDYTFYSNLSNTTITYDIITPELTEVDNNENNKYIFIEPQGTNYEFHLSPSSCSSTTKSNVFTCYNSYDSRNNLAATKCNIYDNENGEWLDQPIIINSRHDKAAATELSQYTLSCFGDTFLVIWYSFNCNNTFCNATSKYFYTSIDGNTFNIIRQNVSIFEDLPVDNYIATISANSQDPNKLLFTLNAYEYGGGSYIFSVHYDDSEKALVVDNGNNISSVPSYINAISYSINDKLYWVLPIQYTGYYDVQVYDADVSLETSMRIKIPTGKKDVVEIVALNMLNEYGNYFGIINLDWNYHGIFGGEVGVNFTAIELTQDIELVIINKQPLFYVKGNVTDPGNWPVMCVNDPPDGSNDIFLSFFLDVFTAPPNADNSPQAQIWEVSFQN